MKKLYLTVSLLIMLGTLLALPLAYTATGNPALYKKLNRKAQNNLKTLPQTTLQSYQKLYKEHQDILMAYLLAYESNVNLAAASPETVLSNYHAVETLLGKEIFSYSPEFFLSYIAKQTVSDEALTPYRQAMLNDGLQEVLDSYPNPLDRFRATALWCVSRLQFQQTSGRDQSPLDITQRSLIGRCEEMQILFVAAARTVGLPSRPASTPWWAHMDNNHAWAEVWLDGAWHYTGDMDAAWFPDQTWFSGMIDKTVMILADGSLAAENDEILSTGTYDTLINSTRNYAKDRTRKLKLKVKKPNGKPAAGATVIPMVFNWGSLRALSYLTTDEKGYLEFSCGRGAFYLSIYHKGLQTQEFISSNDEQELHIEATLEDGLLRPAAMQFQYPGNPMTWDKQPEAYQSAVKAEKQLWNDKNDAFIKLAKENITPAADSLTLAVAYACKGNWPAFAKFLKHYRSIDPDFCMLLLESDPKFLWQANADQFRALYSFYIQQKPSLHGAEEDQVLLSPTVFFEELSQPWIDEKGNAWLYPQEYLVAEGNSTEKVARLMTLLHKKHKLKPRKALSGLLPLHLAVAQKHLNNYQFKILACSMLRANGIPADYTRLPDLITIYLDGDWEYYNVVKSKWEDRSESDDGKEALLKLRITDDLGIPVHATEEQLNLCRNVEGTFYPLVNRFEYLGNGWHQTRFKAQDAYLHFGYRVSDSDTRFTQHVIAAKDDSLVLNITATSYPRKWQQADPQILAVLDEDSIKQHEVILIGNYDQENSRRIADKLQSSGTPFLWLGYENSPTQLDSYRYSPAWAEIVAQDSRSAFRSITLLQKDGGWQMFEGLWDKLP